MGSNPLGCTKNPRLGRGFFMAPASSRAEGTTGSITSSGTIFHDEAYDQPDAGAYEGPVEVGMLHQSYWWLSETMFEIVGDGNEVTIHPE